MSKHDCRRFGDGGVPNYFRRTAIRHWRQQLAGRAALLCNAPVRDRTNAVLLARRHVARCLIKIVHQRLKKPDFNRSLTAMRATISGRGSWFVATSEELPELQRRVDEKADDYSVVTGQRRVGEHSVRRWRLSKMPLPVKRCCNRCCAKSRSVAQSLLLYPQQLS